MDKDAFCYLNVPKPDEQSGVVDPTNALLYLAKRGQSRNLIIMVGAGASSSAGLAPWAEIGDVLKEILKKTDDGLDDVPELASIYIEHLEEQLRQPDAAKVRLIFLINNILKSSKNAKKHGYWGQIYPRLVRLPVDKFYTTNWDDLLPECLLEYSANNKPSSYIRCLDNQSAKFETDIHHGKTRDVVYLHGTLQGPYDQLIITSEDYRLFEKKAEHVFKRLLRQFKEDTTMLCVGYSFSDLHVAEYIQKALVRGHPASNVYALFGKLPKDARKLWRHRGIYPISLTNDLALVEEALCRFLDLLNDAIDGKPVSYVNPKTASSTASSVRVNL